VAGLAGIVALMLEAKPSLTSGEIKRLLKVNASKPDDFKKRQDYWGYGRLDNDAVMRLLDAVRPPRPGAR
jgi:hypothetical protein